MPLSPGTTLGPYSVTAKIGEGGMGEVYRARDTKLDRDVALKVLPQAFTDDPDRLARFEREAKVLASLNHPNIGHIYGLEETEGQKALVLELIEGPTLADRIKQGPIPVDEALPIATQIAEALEAAHEQGIIHRDLKPANIKLKPDGTVKVLDFGLAKALATEGGDVDLSQSPTVTAAGTNQGVLLGTAAYMSPEQARGQPVDKRTDIWSFGCVLYEMLSGRSAFGGNTLSDTIANVLDRSPDWSALPAELPVALGRVLRLCLAVQSKKRIRDIGDVQLAIGGVFESEEKPDVSSRTPSRAPTMAAVLAGAALLVATLAWMGRDAGSRPAVSRFALTSTTQALLGSDVSDPEMAISPDGTSLVYHGLARGGQKALFVRAMDELEPRQVDGLEGLFVRTPFVSADGTAIGYFQGDAAIQSIPIGGGPVRFVCSIPAGGPQGASWGADDIIIFATTDPSTGLWRVEATGGEAEPVTTPAVNEGDHLFPEVLPGGHGIVFTIGAPSVANSQIAAFDYEAGTYKALLRGTSARYASSGHLVFGRDDALWVVGFAPETLTTVGDPIRLIESVAIGPTGAVDFAISENGTLAYFGGGSPIRNAIGWVDRAGTMTEVIVETNGPHTSLSLSPDGSRLAYEGGGGIWLHDFRSSADALRTGYGATLSWRQDDRSLMFASMGSGVGELYVIPADGTSNAQSVLTMEGVTAFDPSWSPDSQHFVFNTTPVERRTPIDRDLWVSTLEGPPRIFVDTDANERGGRFSPDGKWIAYISNDSGEDRVMMRPFPAGDRVVPVSPAGGTEPLWSRDGTELYFRDDSSMLVVSVNTNTGEVGVPQVLFADDYLRSNRGHTIAHDVSADGQFVMRHLSGGPVMHVVLNWHEELLERVPIP